MKQHERDKRNITTVAVFILSVAFLVWLGPFLFLAWTRGRCSHNGLLTDKSPAWTVDISEAASNPTWPEIQVTICKRCGRLLSIMRHHPYSGIDLGTNEYRPFFSAEGVSTNKTIWTRTLRGGNIYIFPPRRTELFPPQKRRQRIG